MRASGELRIWGLYDQETLAGVIASRGPSHISLLFVRKEYHRRGIARALLAVAEESCRLSGRSEITVNSSPYAVEVYHRLGFVDTDKEKVMNGIRFTPMKYTIKQASPVMLFSEYSGLLEELFFYVCAASPRYRTKSYTCHGLCKPTPCRPSCGSYSSWKKVYTGNSL